MTPIPHSRPLLPTGEEWTEGTLRLAAGWIADGARVGRRARRRRHRLLLRDEGDHHRAGRPGVEPRSGPAGRDPRPGGLRSARRLAAALQLSNERAAGGAGPLAAGTAAGVPRPPPGAG